MHRLRLFLTTGILVAVIVLAAIPIQADFGRPMWAYYSKPVSHEAKGGRVTLDFTVRVGPPQCTEIEATVLPHDGVENPGVASWTETIEFPDHDPRFGLERAKWPTFTKPVAHPSSGGERITLLQTVFRSTPMPAISPETSPQAS